MMQSFKRMSFHAGAVTAATDAGSGTTSGRARNPMVSSKHIIDRAFAALGGIVDAGVLVLDTAGHLLFANSSACVLLGCADKEVLDEHWATLEPLFRVRPGPLPGADAPLRRAIEIRVANAARQLRVEIHALESKVDPGWLVLLKNRKTVDARDAILLSATRMHTQAFLHGALSHDLKTPLNSMQITLELLGGAIADIAGASGGESTAHLQRYVGVLREDVARLNRELEGAAGPSIRAVERSFDLRDVVRETAARLEPHLRREGVAFQLSLPEDAMILRGADDQLQQALLNAAIYLLETTPGAGRLNVECTTQQRTAIVSISGDGPPIPARTVDAIYRVFFRPETSPEALGLYVARVAIDAFGGEFRVEAGVAGSVGFRCLLPCA